MKPPIKLTRYWRQRRELAYHRQAIDYLAEFGPACGTLLDIGGGVTRGCRYLAPLAGRWDCTSVELPSKDAAALRGVRVVAQDFMQWTPDNVYDVVFCLQVLEHVADPPAFCAKLFSLANVLVVISVPYQWAPGAEPTHSHDPVDDAKLRRWTGRDPIAQQIVDQHPYRRLVAAYPRGNA